jgi:hypothetical protein
MYRFNDRQRRRLLEDALVEFLLDAPAARPATGRATRPEPKTAPASARPEVATR